MELQFWGVRGSYPSPLLPENYLAKIDEIVCMAIRQRVTLKTKQEFIDSLPVDLKTVYGGNTSCVTISDGDNLLILDGGTGLRVLGDKLLKCGLLHNYHNHLNMIFSHTHLDHINGVPFFLPLYNKDVSIDFYSVHPNLEKILETQQQSHYHPVNFHKMGAKKNFKQLDEEQPVMIGSLKVENLRLNHPNGSFAYKITDANGKKIVYATDAEYKANDYDRYVEFYRDADLLIYDAQYTILDLAYFYDYGHSTPVMGVDFAVLANVKKLLLFHHNPAYNEKQIHEGLITAKEYLSQKYKNENLEIIIANEGMTFNL